MKKFFALTVVMAALVVGCAEKSTVPPPAQDQAAPAETAPAETAPAETAPTDTAPAEGAAETTP